jgi:hypothetical protein
MKESITVIFLIVNCVCLVYGITRLPTKFGIFITSINLAAIILQTINLAKQ